MTNIYGIKANDSLMCGYLCIGFTDFMLNGKSFLDYTNLFSPDEYKKNDKVILEIFSITKKVKMKKICCVICCKYKNVSYFYYLQ